MGGSVYSRLVTILDTLFRSETELVQENQKNSSINESFRLLSLCSGFHVQLNYDRMTANFFFLVLI